MGLGSHQVFAHIMCFGQKPTTHGVLLCIVDQWKHEVHRSQSVLLTRSSTATKGAVTKQDHCRPGDHINSGASYDSLPWSWPRVEMNKR